jgi:PAS domain S-box-containing protein
MNQPAGSAALKPSLPDSGWVGSGPSAVGQVENDWSPVALFVLVQRADGQGAITAANPACRAMLSQGSQVTATPTLRQVLRRMLRPDHRRLRDGWTTSAQSLGRWEAEFVLDPGSAEARHVLLRATPRRHEDGSVEWRGCLDDRTEELRRLEAIRERERTLQLMFSANPNPMWVFDIETYAILEVNDTAVHHYGYSREEFTSMTIKDLRPPEDVIRLEQHQSHRSGPGLDRAGVWRHIKSDGSLIFVNIQTQTLEFAGRPCELVVAIDLTERIRAEDTLRLSEERLGLALQAAGAGMWDWNLAKDLVYLSPNYWAMIESSPEQDVADLDLLRRYTHPDDLPAGLALLQSCIEGPQDAAEHCYRLISRSGRERWMHGQVLARERDASGRATRLVGMVRDITQAKLDEARLQEQHRMLEQMSRLARVGAWQLDTATTCIAWSHQAALLHGMDDGCESIALEELLDCYDDEAAHQLSCALGQLLALGTPFTLELPLRQPTADEVQWIRIHGQILVDSARAPVVQGTVQDITRSKFNEDELARLRDQLRDLSTHREFQLAEQRREIAMNLHDRLGPLLSSIKMKLELQTMQPSQDPLASLAALKGMVDSAIQTTREASWHLYPPALDLGLSLALGWLVQDATHGQPLVCQVEVEEPPPWLGEVTAREIYGIAEQALSNVVRHAGASRITLRLRSTPQLLCLDLTDDGVGFVPAQALHKRHFGLFGMQERALRIGAQLAVESRPGTGTIVSLQLRNPCGSPS